MPVVCRVVVRNSERSTYQEMLVYFEFLYMGDVDALHCGVETFRRKRFYLSFNFIHLNSINENTFIYKVEHIVVPIYSRMMHIPVY